jgi:hypothetical protein
MTAPPPVRETNLYRSPIRDLGLAIESTPLEPIVARFEQEIRDRGITRLRPKCYLSTEWGVPFGTIAIGIPFYLARPDLLELHREQVGHIEGMGAEDILRYLRHEMGHVVNYAYKLYETEEWVKLFGSITQPYLEDYRPQPFSRRFVRHLPGWYAQKHPDEDWSETFAVWLSPHRDWRAEYNAWPVALKKLEYCEATMARLREVDPPVTLSELDENVTDLTYTVQQYYSTFYPEEGLQATIGLDGALRAIFEDLAESQAQGDARRALPAGKLIRRLQSTLLAEVFRWTGHFPERTRSLLHHLAERADALLQVYYADREQEAALAITIFVTSLAMNYVHRGSYFPEPEEAKPKP